eukprot:3939966-Rhodomonas_salina.1
MDARGAIRKCFLRSLSSSTIAVAQQARSIAEQVRRRTRAVLWWGRQRRLSANTLWFPRCGLAPPRTLCAAAMSARVQQSA